MTARQSCCSNSTTKKGLLGVNGGGAITTFAGMKNSSVRFEHNTITRLFGDKSKLLHYTLEASFSRGAIKLYYIALNREVDERKERFGANRRTGTTKGLLQDVYDFIREVITSFQIEACHGVLPVITVMHPTCR